MTQLGLDFAAATLDTTETSPPDVAQPETAREQAETLPTLTYQGRTIVGRCRRCRFYIWGEPGSARRDAHNYCGVSRAHDRRNHS